MRIDGFKSCFIFYRIYKSSAEASQTRNCLSKFIYETVFQDVISLINNSVSFTENEFSSSQCTVLDIAGFGNDAIHFIVINLLLGSLCFLN